MRGPLPDSFERELARLDERALASFVADLWAARGFTTRVVASEATGAGAGPVRGTGRDGGWTPVVCTREGETRTVLVDPRGGGRVGRAVRAVRAVRRRVGRRRRPAADVVGAVVPGADHGDVDVVVSPAPDARAASLAAACGATLVDAPALYEFALYALDRAAADAVFERHLGHGIEAPSGPAPSQTETGAGAGGSTRGETGAGTGVSTPGDAHGPWLDRVPAPSVLLSLALVVVIVASIGVAGLGLGGLDDGTPADAPGDGTAAGPDDVPTATEPVAPPSSSLGVGDAPERAASMVLAPGLSGAGITDVDALAAAHATGVDGRSYVWTVTYVERRDGAVTMNGSAVHRVHNASVHRVDVATDGPVATAPGQLLPRPAYADGDTRYVASRGRVFERPAESRDHYAGHARTALARLLRVEESDVVDGRHYRGTFLHLVSLAGSPEDARRDYRATALVSRTGVVHVVQAEWVDPRTNVTVRVRSEYDFVSDPGVTRPTWVGLVNETAAGDAGTPTSLTRPVTVSTA